jgi:hypothetical protein
MTEDSHAFHTREDNMTPQQITIFSLNEKIKEKDARIAELLDVIENLKNAKVGENETDLEECEIAAEDTESITLKQYVDLASDDEEGDEEYTDSNQQLGDIDEGMIMQLLQTLMDTVKSGKYPVNEQYEEEGEEYQEEEEEDTS